MASELVGSAAVVSRDTDETVVSTVTVTELDAVLELPARSVATSAAMDGVTVPSVEPRATSKVYVLASTVTKLDAAGLPPLAVPVTVMSASSKFSTSSLNVAVNVTGSSPVVVPSAGVIVTVGIYSVYCECSRSTCCVTLYYRIGRYGYC